MLTVLYIGDSTYNVVMLLLIAATAVVLWLVYRFNHRG